KVAECGRSNGRNGRHQAKSQSEPTLSVQGAPPILPSHGPAPPPGDGSRLFVALAVDWFKRDGVNGKVGDAPKLTNGLMPALEAALAESRKFPGPFFTARLRPRLSHYRRPPTP